MKKQLLELLGIPVSRIEFEIEQSLDELNEVLEWAEGARVRIERFKELLETV